MFQYTIKRILMMVPTFFVVSVVIFLVLNMAPGRPGRAGQQGISQTSESANAQESFRIFKEQFSLDKPIFLNTRFMLEKEEIEQLVGTAVIYGKADVPAADKPRISAVVEAQEQLEDLGSYAVPHLYAIAVDHPDPDYRWYATQRLTVSAKRRLNNEFSTDQLSEAEKQLNSEIDTENTIIGQWQYGRNAPEAERKKIEDNWRGWYTEHADRFEYSGADKASILVLDTRFGKYWGNLLKLDFGVSNIDRKPVLAKVLDKLKYSITLSFATIILIYVIAVPLGVFSAVRQNSVADQILTVILFMLYSLPSFFVGVLLLNLLAIGPKFALWPGMPSQSDVELYTLSVSDSGLLVTRAVIAICTLAYLAWAGWNIAKDPEKRTPGRFLTTAVIAAIVYLTASVVSQLFLFGSVEMFPAGGFESSDAGSTMTTLEHLVDITHHLVLPVFCLTYGGLAAISRYARSGLLDVIRADYIRTARAKGLSEPVVIIKHATRNGMIPILTLLGTLLPSLIGGSVIIEIIFGIPGMGMFLFDSILTKDYNVVMGVLLVSSLLTLVGLLLSDISYALVDPRISFK